MRKTGPSHHESRSDMPAVPVYTLVTLPSDSRALIIFLSQNPRMNDISSTLGAFELLDQEAETKANRTALDWSAPHWIPNPVPSDWDIFAAPWLRPEQVAMSFVGELLLQHTR